MNQISQTRSQAFTLALLIVTLYGTAWADEKKESQVPPELKGVKLYQVPEEGKRGASPENPVIYKNLAYEDINLQRLVLNLRISVKPFDRSATISRIYFQDIRANGIPVQVETFEQEFKISKKEIVDLPAPLRCTIVFSDLETLAPLKEIINQDKITVTGQSFIEVKLSTLQKIAVRSKRLALPVPLQEKVTLQMFAGNPLLRMAANGILDTLMDPASAPAIALAKEHVAKLTGTRALEQKGSASLYLVYSEYALRDPKSGAAETFSQSGTAFVISPDGKLATAKRVVEPWKFDPQTVLMMTRDGLAIDPQSVRVAAWPVGANLRAQDGTPDLGRAFSSAKKTLRILRLSPDRLEKFEYKDAESAETATLEVHAGGESDLAILQLTGGNFQPLELAATSAPASAGSRYSLLGFPFALSQAQAKPRPVAVTAAARDDGLALDGSLNPGQSGAPLVTADGKVVAICSEPNRCVTVESLRKLIP